MTLSERLRAGFGRMACARDGSVATIFAVALVPVVIAAGIGIDVTRASSGRADLQDALDATALALAHLPTSTPQATIDADAKNWLNANLSNSALGPVVLTTTLSSTQIVLNATSYTPTTLTAIAGYKQVPIAASSTVKWGVGHVEVALVLDNTGSMSQNSKLTNLVSSAKTLVTTLLASNTTADPSAVKISIVPFSNMVNVGATYKNATWIDPTSDAYDGTSTDIFNVNPYNGSAVNRFTLYTNLGLTWAGCVESRPQWVNGVDKSYDVTDTVPSTGSPGTRIVPAFAPDEPDDQDSRGNDVYTNNYLGDGNPSTGSNWDDLQGNIVKYYNTTVCSRYNSNGSCRTWTKTSNSPTLNGNYGGNTNLGTGYPYGPNFGCGVQPLQRLTNSSSTLTTLLGKMVAAGDTNVPMGLFWGWMTLSPNAPFADGVAYNTAGVTKIVIVLTDGANNSSYSSSLNGSDDSYYSGVGYQFQHLISQNSGSFTNPSSAMNDREAKICTNMKADNIVIYAVPLEVTDATAKTLLQNCASSSDKYLDVSSSSQLSATFTSIAGSIGNLRIAQ